MKKINRTFPSTRLRRTRMQKFSRNLTSENLLTSNDLIWPVFIMDGQNNKKRNKINASYLSLLN